MTKKQPERNDRIGVDRLGRTELHYVAANGNEQEVVRLLGQGADANAKDEKDWSPLHFAAQANSAQVALVLLSARAEVDAIGINGNTPLSNAVFNSRGKGELIEILRRSGADPRRENHHGISPVGLARTIANYDIAQFFRDIP